MVKKRIITLALLALMAASWGEEPMADPILPSNGSDAPVMSVDTPAGDQPSAITMASLGVEFNPRVNSKLGFMNMDPSIGLTISNQVRLNSITGLGFYFLSEQIHFLYDLGMGLDWDRLSLDARYQDTASEFMFLPVGGSAKQGFESHLGIKLSQEIGLRLGFFYGALSTANHRAVPAYWLVSQVYGRAYLDLLSYMDYSARVIWPQTVQGDLGTVAIDIEVPFHFMGGKINLYPRLGYVKRQSRNANALLDDFRYDFGSFTIGPATGASEGNVAAVLNVDWKFYPLEGLDVPFVKGFYFGPCADAGLFFGPEQATAAAQGGFALCAMVGFDYWNTLFEVRLGYRSDVKDQFVFGFSVKGK